MAGYGVNALAERIESRIFLLRGEKIMLSTDLAHLHEVEPRALVQAVKRNLERFPADFMFQLNDEEFRSLKSQIVTSSWGGLRRVAPYAFTEQGVAMLSTVLRGKRSILGNIESTRAVGQTAASAVSRGTIAIAAAKQISQATDSRAVFEVPLK